MIYKYLMIDFNLLYLLTLTFKFVVLIFFYERLYNNKMQKERGPVMSWELRWEAERGVIGVGGLAGSKTTVGDTVPCLGDDAMFFRFALYYYLDPPFSFIIII